jgi:hypothetical protein
MEIKMAESKGRNVPRNRKRFLRQEDVNFGPSLNTMVPGISPSQKEPDYPTSAPSFSKRPKARAKPVRPKARPEKIEQEAAEAAAVAQGNKEALRRVKEEKAEKKMYGGKMKKPVAMKSGGKMPMVKKGGKSVPAFAADGVGKMSYGGKMPKKMGLGGKMGKCRGMGAATRGGNFKMG